MQLLLCILWISLIATQINSLKTITLEVIADTKPPYIPYEQFYPYVIQILYEKSTAGRTKGNVLLLHDYNDNSELWDTLGVLKALADNGYDAYAMDYPGLPKSESRHAERLHLAHDYELIPLMRAIYTELGIAEAVIVAPIYATKYGMYMVSEFDGPALAAGLVLISPKKIPTVPEKIRNIKSPVLAIYGANDKSAAKAVSADLAKLSTTETVVIPDARRSFYKTSPEGTQAMLDAMISFLDTLNLQAGGTVKPPPIESKGGGDKPAVPRESGRGASETRRAGSSRRTGGNVFASRGTSTTSLARNNRRTDGGGSGSNTSRNRGSGRPSGNKQSNSQCLAQCRKKCQ